MRIWRWSCSLTAFSGRGFVDAASTAVAIALNLMSLSVDVSLAEVAAVTEQIQICWSQLFRYACKVRRARSMVKGILKFE